MATRKPASVISKLNRGLVRRPVPGIPAFLGLRVLPAASCFGF
jgi:hypothetical protein